MPSTRRYADWRPLAVRRVPAQWLGTLAGTLVFAVLVALLHEPNYVLYAAPIATAAGVGRLIVARRLASLRDEGEDRQFATTLRLDRGSAYGYDEGLVSFENGFLVFMGRRCAFSLGARDVYVFSANSDDLLFVFKGPGGRHIARIQLKKNEGFAKVVGEWRAAGRRSHASVLPPVLPNPEFPRLAAILIGALPYLALAAALPGLAPLSAAKGDLPDILCALALAGVAGASVRQGRELGRLARGERRPATLLGRWRRRRRALQKPRDRILSLQPQSVAVPEPQTRNVTQGSRDSSRS